VVIGDIASSVSLVDVGDGKIESVARDYAPLFPFALEALSEDSFIGANVSVGILQQKTASLQTTA
jgi:DNA damage-binding protein 1